MLIFQAQRSCTLKLRVVDAHGSKGQCWTCSVYINFMHQEGWETSFSKTMHAELSALMKSSAQTIAKPLYSSDICAFYRIGLPYPKIQNVLWIESKTQVLQSSYKMWDMDWNRARETGNPVSVLLFHNLIIPGSHTLWLSYTCETGSYWKSARNVENNSKY